MKLGDEPHRAPLAEAGRTVLRAVVALPCQIAVVSRSVTSRNRAAPNGTRAPESRSRPIARALVGLPIALVANVLALVIAFSIARAVYYPFWAAGASQQALERSWGGPSAVGATLVHWLVAAVTIVIAFGVIFAMQRLGERSSEGG